MTNAVVGMTTVVQDFPPATKAGNYHFELTLGGVAVAKQDVTSGGVTFGDVAPGTYVVTVQLLDELGAALGGLVASAAFVVDAPAPVAVTLQVPATLTVTLG